MTTSSSPAEAGRSTTTPETGMPATILAARATVEASIDARAANAGRNGPLLPLDRDVVAGIVSQVLSRVGTDSADFETVVDDVWTDWQRRNPVMDRTGTRPATLESMQVFARLANNLAQATWALSIFWEDNFDPMAFTPETGYPYEHSLDEVAWEVSRFADAVSETADIMAGRA